MVWVLWPQRRATKSPTGQIPTLLDSGIL